MARIVLAIILLVAAGVAPAWAGPVLGPDEIMPTSEIRPGMTAVGKSVFRGTEIEEFHLEILGVLHKVRIGGDVILARVLDGTLIERQSGILRGMSGSPVYIGDRLIGAIAFSWAFSKEPVTGITPIEDMLRVLAGDSPAQASSAAADLPHPLRVGVRTIRSVRILGSCAALPPDAIEPPGVMTLRPVGSLLLASGMPQRALGRLRELVEPYGAAVAQGVGGSSDFDAGALEPGSAMGVQLVRGDFDVTSIGTVTCVVGDQVLALGHPMMSMGEVDLALTTAYIHDIVPSYAFSMKMGVAGRPVGRIAQDRPWAIAGITGSQARAIPVSISVSDAKRGRSQTFNAEIARHRLLSPGLAAIVALSAVDRAWEHVGEGTAQVTVEIESADRTIRRTDAAFDPTDAAATVTTRLVGPLSMLMHNEFGRVEIKSVRVTTRLVGERETARLERVSVQPGKIKAGDLLKLKVLLRPFRGERVEKRMELKLPPDLPDGKLGIGVAGGGSVRQLRSMLGLAARRPFDLDQLVHIYETSERADEIVALAALPTAGVAVRGRRLPSLPGFMLEVLGDAGSSIIDPHRDSLQASLPCEWIVEGRQVISVEIEGKPGAAKARAPTPPRPAPDRETPREDEDKQDDEGREAMAARSTSMTHTATGANSEQGEAKKDEEKKKEKKEEPIGRGPSSWTHAARSDFLPGEFDDIACDEDGVLTLAPRQKTIAQFEEPAISAALAHASALYVATAPAGRVRKLSASGDVERTWETGAVMVTSMIADSHGTILAGCTPDGLILALAPDGEAREYFATGEEHVWALAPAPDGGLYAATGPNGKVFLVTGEGEGKVLCSLPATNVHALAATGDTLYAGTGNAGVIYAIDRQGGARAVYDSDEQAVTCLAARADGEIYEVYAGTGPGADVVRLRPDRDAERIMRAAGKHVGAVVAGPGGEVYAVTVGDGVVYEVDPERKAGRVLRKPDHGQAMALAVNEQGAVYVAESNPAAVVRLGPERAARGVFTSKPQQAAAGTRWGVVSCAVDRPEGTVATFRTRSGDSADPDDHWSPWSAPADLGSAASITSPSSRFLQYRIILGAQEPDVIPSVRDLQITYLPPNREPSISISAPKPAERLSGTVELKWKGEDADDDPLVYDLYTSADGGDTWQELKTDVEDDTYSWDTTDLEDGPYLLRVVASDRPSNPAAAREREALRAPWVDNTPPAVLVLRHTVAVSPEGRATVRGVVADELSPLSGVDYRVDEGKWRAAAIEGVVGTQEVSFNVETEPLSAGQHNLELRAFDQAGNKAEYRVRVEVQAAAAEAEATDRPAAESQ